MMRVVHDLCAWHFAGREATPICGRPKAPRTTVVSRVNALPLVFRRPRWVRLGDRFFHLNREGLYRFWDWGQIRYALPLDRPVATSNRRAYACAILYRKDILKLLAALALIHVHGEQHEPLAFPERIQCARRGNLSLTCGYVADFVCRLLRGVGVAARRVLGLRRHGRYNTYSNGHTLFEFYWPKRGKWVLMDVDLHQMFKRHGRYLNLREISDLIWAGQDFDLEPLTVPGMGLMDTTAGVAGKFSASLYLEPLLSHPRLLKEWYRAALATPLIEADNRWWFPAREADADRRVARYSAGYRCLNRAEWLRRFYAKGESR
ncbi:MAG: transglutaminase domain-containing protein [Verrucomicrobia bacterium]|nr:transglutaminase domain-containing protein [Verrucomicrobiota bacterium]